MNIQYVVDHDLRTTVSVPFFGTIPAKGDIIPTRAHAVINEETQEPPPIPDELEGENGAGSLPREGDFEICLGLITSYRRFIQGLWVYVTRDGLSFFHSHPANFHRVKFEKADPREHSIAYSACKRASTVPYGQIVIIG